MRDDSSAQEDSVLAALREVQALSRIPLPTFTTPPWEKVRAALPPGVTLPDRAVHVLVDLDIDATGTVVHAAVGYVPASIATCGTVAACTGPDGRITTLSPLDSASYGVAESVAAGLVGAKFTPGERGGAPVAVRKFRMGLEVSAEVLRSSP